MSRYVSVIVLVDIDGPCDCPEEGLRLYGETVGQIVYSAEYDGKHHAIEWSVGMHESSMKDITSAINAYETEYAGCAECGDTGAVPAANPDEPQDNGYAPCPECNGQRVTWNNDLAYVCGECEGRGIA